jgi:photosystem II stability/assembly factor-like uncharacterized protein
MEVAVWDRLGPRARRALVVIVLALMVIAATGIAYLHPSLPSHPRLLVVPSPPGPPLLSNRYQVTYDFLTPALGWALLRDTTSPAPRFWLLETTDKAKHWQMRLTGSAGSVGGGPLKVQFFGRDNGFIAVGGGADLYRTQDGGDHWTALAVPALSSASIYFCDPLHGWIVGTLVSSDQNTADLQFFSTSDGGGRWTGLPQLPAWFFPGKGGFTDILFRRQSEGWVGAASQQPTVYSTIDGGLTWQAHPLPVVVAGKGGLPQSAQQLAEAGVYLLPGAGVLAATVDANGNSIGLTSFDGGSTWRHVAPPPGETSYGDFEFQDTFHWWAMRYGTLFKSSDAGQSWKEVAQQLDEWDYLPQVVDAKNAWAQMVVVFPNAGPVDGTGLATTTDGGVHWIPVNVPKPS